MAENLAASRLLFLYVVLQRVGHHEVHRVVHLRELLVLLVVGILLRLLPAFLDAVARGVALLALQLVLALLAVGLAHAAFHLLRTGGDVVGTEGTVLNLALVFLLDTPYLVDGDATLHQLGHNLLARDALGVLFYDVVHHLVVGHA